MEGHTLVTGGDSKAAIAQNSINGSCTEGDDDMAEKLNWGIIGAGGIAGTFAENLQHAELGVKCAAGSRSLAKAEAFAAEHGFARAHGSYEALLADEEVDWSEWIGQW